MYIQYIINVVNLSASQIILISRLSFKVSYIYHKIHFLIKLLNLNNFLFVC